MKCFVFVRGIDRQEKREFVSTLMTGLNPDVNSVTAIRLSISDLIPDPETAEKGDFRAADKTVKNQVKRLLSNHSETFLVIDNESFLPQHWQKFAKIAEEIRIRTVSLGINITFDGKMLNTDEDDSSNLQSRNLDAFKADMAKCYEVKIGSTDPVDAIGIANQIKEEIGHVQSGTASHPR